MIVVTSTYLRRQDLSMVRKYAKFVLNKMVRPAVQNKARITIKILGESEIKDAADLLDLKKYKAWCTYDGIDEHGIKKFTVVLDHKHLNKRAKKPLTRLKNILVDL
jgi:hypothetical protein